MTNYLFLQKTKGKWLALAVVSYPEGATTCLARAQDFFYSKGLNHWGTGCKVAYEPQVRQQANFGGYVPGFDQFMGE